MDSDRDGSSAFGGRVRDLRERLGHVRHGKLAAMARDLGISQARYRTWEVDGSQPNGTDLRAAIRRLGLAEEGVLLAWLMDPFGTAPKPSWWSTPGPPPKDPTLLYLAPPDPPKPWDPAPLPPDVQARVDADLAAAEARLAGKALPMEPPPQLPPRPALRRVRELALAAVDASAEGDDAAVARALDEIRSLVCPSRPV